MRVFRSTGMVQSNESSVPELDVGNQGIHLKHRCGNEGPLHLKLQGWLQMSSIKLSFLHGDVVTEPWV